ncbi:amidinotransferase, partial [Burkholderia sp. R-69927]|nr:amidinotransferase [Burkholderia sp. R-69927]
FEYDRVYLEGTGAIVLDHVARIAYTARSRRADPIALQRFCAHFNFEPVTFSTLHRSGCPIYHTNVMMSIATEFSLVCLELIEGDRTRRKLGERMEEGGREVVTLDADQIAQFAGAALELTGSDGLVLAMSERGVACLTAQQRSVIERSARILALRVPTIEMAGGSVSCMLGGIHLTRR